LWLLSRSRLCSHFLQRLLIAPLTPPIPSQLLIHPTTIFVNPLLILTPVLFPLDPA
jgi:hypothetical protein